MWRRPNALGCDDVVHCVTVSVNCYEMTLFNMT